MCLERLHHFTKLFGVVAVRIDAGIGAIGQFRAGSRRVTEIFTLETTDLLFLFDGFGRHSGLRTFLQNIVVIVDVKNEISSVLFGEGDAFVVNQAGVLDGIDAGADSVFDGWRAMSMAATLRPSLRASSAIACISSRVY